VFSAFGAAGREARGGTQLTMLARRYVRVGRTRVCFYSHDISTLRHEFRAYTQSHTDSDIDFRMQYELFAVIRAMPPGLRSEETAQLTVFSCKRAYECSSI
jgi:hypothetical protein